MGDRPAAGQGEVLQEADRGGRGDRRPQPGQVPQGGWSSWRRRSKRRCQRAGNGNEEGPRQVRLPRSLRNHANQSRPASSLSYREFIECRYIGLFRISNSISYRTSHIEYLDILKTNDFFVFFRRKFQKFAENSPKIQKIRRKF